VVKFYPHTHTTNGRRDTRQRCPRMHYNFIYPEDKL
jgi:hypothetical protein